ncbi:MAG: BMP family ABC transporter substrate-binding protein [Spirochaetia bacterium]
MGVRKTNPEAVVKVIRLGYTADAEKRRQAASKLIDEGADILTLDPAMPEPIEVAESEGLYSIGSGSDMKAYGGESVLTSTVWDWKPFFEKKIESAREGTLQGDSLWGGVKTGIVKLTELSPEVPEDVRSLVESEQKKLESGERDVFDAPVTYQVGEKSSETTHTRTDLNRTDLLNMRDEMDMYNFLLEPTFSP